MRKAAGKRLPHGATSDLILAVLWNIHLRTGGQPVSRASLVQAISLPETTVDDRLRVLAKQGKVMKLGRGLYTPMRQKTEPIFDRYWRHRPPLGWKPSPKEKLDKAARQPQPPGKREVLIFPEGVVLIERWLSVADYSRIESKRQQRGGYAGRIPSADEDDCDI